MASPRTLLLASFVGCMLTGCATRPPADENDGTCDPAAPACATGQVCEAVRDGEPRCAGPVTVSGVVLDATTDEPIEGALVQAVDVNGAAAGTSAQSGADGTFVLTVPAVRDADGAPVSSGFTLRAQAATYQRFPTELRPALPIDPSTADLLEGGWVVENPLTTIKLIPLPGDTADFATVTGSVAGAMNSGVLVVAEGASSWSVGFSDAEGHYTIFNVPPGTYTVRGFAQGAQLTANSVTVAAGELVEGIDLAESAEPLATVSGNVQIVNAPGGSVTSVVLAVKSTFVAGAARGEVPPGLRVGEVEGAFTITDVPEGQYVALAAFENDDLVRDPDQTIGGTAIVEIEVPDPVMGTAITISQGFKITGALAVVAPGSDGPDVIDTGTPTFEWADDSSEDGYIIRVFDAFGAEIWTTEIGPVSGSATVSVTYAGPPLETGMFYQFRATSFREKTGIRTLISATEDLKGVFQFAPAP